MSRKNKQFVVEKIAIQGMAAEGKCIAKHEDKVIFIAGNEVAPKDVVDLQVYKKRKKYFEAKPIHFHEYSDLRQEAFCEHFGTCGGCKWQHIQYNTQLQYKHQQVVDALERIAKVALPKIQPILASAQTKYYRNKLEFTFSNKKWLTQEQIEKQDEIPASAKENALGFHIAGRFDKILDLQHCYLQNEISDKIRLAVKKYALKTGLSFFDIREQHGLLRNLVIRTTSTQELMVIVLFFEDQPEEIKKLLTFLDNTFPEITSLQYIINPKKNDSYQDLEVNLFAGLPYIQEKMENLSFRIGPKSFYQTNSEQAYELYKVARDFADLQGHETVYDLYTGTGTIANFVAHQAQKVVGVEYVPEAIEDAKINSQINNIHNTAFLAGDIKDILNHKFVEKYGKADVLITDPPRAGMHAEVVQSILEIEAPKIVYVSCNPATQARDLALLDEKYKVTKVQPVDMFPQTHHVENVVKLELKSI